MLTILFISLILIIQISISLSSVQDNVDSARQYSDTYYTNRNIAIAACFSICFVTYVCCGFLMVYIIIIIIITLIIILTTTTNTSFIIIRHLYSIKDIID